MCTIGQARKSLWIETLNVYIVQRIIFGQARKSLWIETQITSQILIALPVGQARKSLWIETPL